MDQLTAQILEHEGERLFPYTDTVGKLTIGIGRNLSDRGISHDEAIYLFNNDVAESRRELSHYDWFNNLDEVRQGVLIELHFNIGLTKLLQFKQMLGFIEKKYFANAANQLIKSLWAKQVGSNRSNSMAYRMRTGTYR